MGTPRSSVTVLALGALGLAAALTTAAFVAPDRAIAAAPVFVPDRKSVV